MTSNENQPGANEPTDHGPWDPNEEVGDIYAVEFDERGITSVEKLSHDRPQIWVGSLSDYNNGVLYGEWIDAAREPDEIHADIARILAGSPTAAETGQPAEEWGIFDSDNFGAARIGEYDPIELVARIARGIAEHGLAFAAWADVMEGMDDALDQFEDNYLGHYDSVEAYAEQLVDDLGIDAELDRAISGSLRNYVKVDTKALASDMQLGGDIHVMPANDGGVWLFDAR